MFFWAREFHRAGEHTQVHLRSKLEFVNLLHFTVGRPFYTQRNIWLLKWLSNCNLMNFQMMQNMQENQINVGLSGMLKCKNMVSQLDMFNSYNHKICHKLTIYSNSEVVEGYILQLLAYFNQVTFSNLYQPEAATAVGCHAQWTSSTKFES